MWKIWSVEDPSICIMVAPQSYVVDKYALLGAVKHKTRMMMMVITCGKLFFPFRSGHQSGP